MNYLQDPWQHKPIILDGFVERQRFAPWFMVFFALSVGFVTFQFVVAPIAIVAILLSSGVPPAELLDTLLEAVENDAQLMLIANTIGQFIGLALPVLLIAKLSSSSRMRFLRVTKTSPVFLFLSLCGLAALIPIVDFAASLNSALPWPESIRNFEKLMAEPLKNYLSKPENLIPGILMIAATPALCEELLFRGYVLRQVERSTGSTWAIIFTGFIFGAFHLLPTQFLPLSILGLYMAYLTWRTGSIWPAVLVHFANNTFAVVVSIFFNPEDNQAVDPDRLGLPYYYIVAGVVVFACCVYLIESIGRAKLMERQARTETLVEAEVDNE